MINKTLLLTYLYLLIYILLSSGVILYNKVLTLSFLFYVLFHTQNSNYQFCVCECPNLCLQWVLSPKYFNFPLPITLTMIHMGFSGAVAFMLVRVFKVLPFSYVSVILDLTSLFADSDRCI
jgi:hypothetical protein